MIKRIPVVLFLILGFVTGAKADVTDYRYPGAAANASRSGSTDAWNNPTDVLIKFSGDWYSTIHANTNPLPSGTGTQYSDWLRVTNFGFSIPAGSTIDGLEIWIPRLAMSSNAHYNYSSIRWRITSGQVGNDAFPGTEIIPDWSYVGGTSDTIGGPAATFGRTWTVDEINSPDFGLDISVDQDVARTNIAKIFTVNVKVYYTPPSSAGSYKVGGIASPAKVAKVINPTKVAGVVTGAPPPSDYPTVYLASSIASCPQTAGTKTIEVRLSQASTQPVTVYWDLYESTTYDTAQFTTNGSGRDVSASDGSSSGSITFSPGEVSKNITLTIYDVFKISPDLKMWVWLTAAENANISTQDNCLLTIIDTDKTSGCDFTMTALPSSCPIGGCSGWGGSSWNLVVGSANDGANNKSRMQAFLTHFRTYHSGSKVLCRFPAGTTYFNLKSTLIELPTANNRWSFWGVKDGTSSDTTGHTILRYCPNYWTSYSDTACFFRNYATGSYELSAESSLNAVLFRCLIIDADNLNCGNYDQLITVPAGDEDADYLLEHYTVIKLRGLDPTRRLNYTTERMKIQNSPTGAMNPGYFANNYIYRYHAENCVKGFATQSATYSTVYAYDVKSFGDRFGGNLWQESAEDSPRELRIIGDNITFENTAHFTAAPYEGGNTISNLNVGKFSYIYQAPTSANIAINQFWSGLTGVSEYNGGTVYTYQGSKIHYTGTQTWRNITFILYDHSKFYDSDMSAAPYLRYLPYSWNVYGPYHTFTNCTFRCESKCPGYYAYGFGALGGKSWTDKTDAYTKFNGCIFENSLDGALKLGYSNPKDSSSLGGCQTVEFNNCTFNCNNNKPLFTLNAWSDAAYTGRLIINGATIASTITNIYHIYGYGDSTKQNNCWIYHNYDLTKAQAENSITQTSSSGIKNLCVANAACNSRISSIPRSSQTTVTTSEAHGLTTGDKIIFDGFDSTSNASWFTNMSPHSSVPLFTAEVVNSTQFKVKNAAGSAYIDSSGYSANYSSSADMARVSKYPFRTITGGSGDNPGTSKPAGLIGDRYNAGGTYYRCTMSGVQGVATWAAE